MKIGEIMAADREITLNEGKKTVTVTVEFDTAGVKKLFAGFAKLKKI